MKKSNKQRLNLGQWAFKSLLLSSVCLGLSTLAFAQTAEPEDEVIVTGTQIKGAQINDVLPVTVLDLEAIETVDAGSGDELFRSIPQAGQVAFNEQSTAGGVNGARGDIASINLRGLGTGNTLLLINGRRMVLNPGFQTELFVPVVSPDTNTVNPGGIRRVEVLRDGASAVYGADAVAGVVNTHLKDNLEGGFLQGNYRRSTGTDLYSASVRGGVGYDFNEDRSNLTLFGYYFHENGAPTSIRDYSRSSDLRPFLEGTDFEGDTQFDNRSINSPFGAFDTQGSSATSSNTTVLRDDDFHLQPCSFFGASGEPSDGRFIDLGNGLCADNGGTIDRDLRADLSADRNLFSEKDRLQFQALLNHELSESAEYYFEGSYYRSESSRQREPNTMLSAVPIGILAQAYYNPFGATTLNNGAPNPNRVTTGIGPGVTDAGRDLLLEDYRFYDVGPRQGNVTKNTFRLVTGVRGEMSGWDYDTGFVYSKARTNDFTANRISGTALQDAINRNDPTAYNPFNGGCIGTSFVAANNVDCTPSDAQTIQDVSIDVTREGETTLALADLKVSKPDLFVLPGGDVGLAAGVEFRRETFIDDRDPRLDGSITFTNAVNGDFFGSDVVGSSPSPDTSGNREVYSGFIEAFVPLVAEDMEIPLVRGLDLQLAGRFESFSDSGSTFVPRAAASWTPVQGIIFRGAWSKGFRAPNLVQVNDLGTQRSNSEIPAVECVAEIIQGIEPDVGDCGTRGLIDFRVGGSDLQPEKTTNINLGIVLEPEFIPGFTFTADYWRIRQNGIVGILGNQNALYLDLIQRLNGSSNPNVLRDAPDAGQIALYAGTGINPAGDIQRILNPYQNLDSRTSKGADFSVIYDVGSTPIGDLKFQVNAARLISFQQSPGESGAPLAELESILSGIPELSAGDVATLAAEGFGELIERDGRPKWRLSGSLNLRNGPVRFSMFARYVDEWNDPSATQDDTGALFRVDDWFTVNTSVSYTFDNDSALDGTRIKVGLNNIFDQDPPIADESYGFFGELHSARGRQLSLEVKKSF
jgi:outer membrane receptor protein involved in Fe transport